MSIYIYMHIQTLYIDYMFAEIYSTVVLKNIYQVPLSLKKSFFFFLKNSL